MKMIDSDLKVCGQGDVPRVQIVPGGQRRRIPGVDRGTYPVSKSFPGGQRRRIPGVDRGTYPVSKLFPGGQRWRIPVDQFAVRSASRDVQYTV